MSEQNAIVATLDAPELSIADYRTLRSGGELAPKVSEPTPSAAADATPAVADAEVEGEVANTNEEPKGGKKSGLEFRFSELTNQVKTLKAQLAQKSGGAPAEPTPKPEAVAAPSTANDPEPDPNKFGDYTEWQKAQIKWELRQSDRVKAADAAKADAQKTAQAQAETWNSRVTEASKEHADFEAVALNPELSVSNVMADAIRDTEVGAKILYELGKNPDEATRISKLHPLAQVREIGKLEAKLTAAAAAQETPQTPKPQVVSKAPAPIKPVGGGSASANPAKSVETMSQAEYRAYRESGKIR